MNKFFFSIAIAILFLNSVPAFAQAPVMDFAQNTQNAASMDERLRKVERLLENRTLVDLAIKIEELQQELQKMIGVMEVQSHAIDELKRRQKDLYIDLDRRIQRVENGGSSLSSSSRDSLTRPDSQGGNFASTQSTPGGSGFDTRPKSFSATPDNVPSSGDTDKQEYNTAFNMLRKRNYNGAISSFKAFLSRFPESDYADNAQYWIGEANFVQRNFDEALVEFGNVLNNFSGSPKYPEAMLKIGLSHVELKNWKLARNVFDEIISRFPNTVESRIAEKNRQTLKLDGH